tara:strand:+ start:2673 stop:3062 length:390 start_codon:yes stop_codon:yes gene_type:complete
MINQLFSKPVSLELLNKVLLCFNLNGLDDKKIFTKYDLEICEAVECLNAIKDELYEVYLPCKANTYLNNINLKRSITILRQIVKLFGYNVKSCERSVTKKKVTAYHLVPINSDNKVKIINQKNMIITFD